MKQLKLAVSFLICLSVSRPGFAMNMEQIRGLVKSSEQGKQAFDETPEQIRESQNATLQRFFQALRVDSSRFLSFANDLSKSNLPRSQKIRHSSYRLKSLMDQGVMGLMQREKVDAPIPYDPSWTPKEHIEKLKTHQCDVGISQFLGKKTSVESRANKIDDFLAVLISAKDDSKDLNQSGVTTGQSAMVTAFLNNSPKNKSGKSLLEVLGDVKGAEVEDGSVQRLVFSKKGVDLPIGFSVAATLLSGEDEAFVSFQSCLLSYFQLQQMVLETKGSLRSTLQTYVSTVASADPKSQVDMINQSYYGMLDLEGKAGLTEQALATFVKKRKAQLSLAIPILLNKDHRARELNARVNALSKEQKAYLFATLLSLQIRDIPTAKEQGQLSQALAPVIGSASGTLKDDLEISYEFYHLLGRQLRSLETQIEEKKELDKGRVRDLEAIRRLKKS